MSQLITFSAVPNSGTWTISDGTNTTSGLGPSDDATTVAAATSVLIGGPYVVNGSYTSGFGVVTSQALTVDTTTGGLCIAGATVTVVQDPVGSSTSGFAVSTNSLQATGSFTVNVSHYQNGSVGSSFSPIYAWAFTSDGTDSVDSNPASVTGSFAGGTSGLQCNGTTNVATAADTGLSDGTEPFTLSCTYVPSVADVGGGNPLGADSYFLGWGVGDGSASFLIGQAGGQFLFYCASNPQYTGYTITAGTSYDIVVSWDGSSQLSGTINGTPFGPFTESMSITLAGSPSGLTFGADPGGGRAASGVLSDVVYNDGSSDIYSWAFGGDGNDSIDSNPATVTGSFAGGSGLQCGGSAVATAGDSLIPTGASPFQVSYDYIASSSEESGGLTIALCIGTALPSEAACFGTSSGGWAYDDGVSVHSYGTVDTNPHSLEWTFDGTTMTLYVDSVLTGTFNPSVNIVQSGTIYFGDFADGGYAASGILSNVVIYSSSGGTDEIQEVNIPSPPTYGGEFTLTLPDSYSTGLTFDVGATAATIQTAISADPSYPSVNVTGSSPTWYIDYGVQESLSLATAPGSNYIVWSVSIPGSVNAGTFNLSDANGSQSVNVPWNATTGDATWNSGGGDVATISGGWVLNFGITNATSLTGDGTNLVENASEVQEVTIPGTVDGGSFTLTYPGGPGTTSPIPYNQDASSMQGNIIATWSGTWADVNCGGGANPWYIIWPSEYYALTTLTGDGSALTTSVSANVQTITSSPGVAFFQFLW